jgi:hypothetical protein
MISGLSGVTTYATRAGELVPDEGMLVLEDESLQEPGCGIRH